MSLVVVGSVAYDGLETPHGKVDRILGGSCTYIALAASYFTTAKIVGVVGDDFAQEDVDFLKSRGVDLEGLEHVPGKTFFWAGVYSADTTSTSSPTSIPNCRPPTARRPICCWATFSRRYSAACARK
jgi:sugar/nucleoside kinase (ribokinase family)